MTILKSNTSKDQLHFEIQNDKVVADIPILESRTEIARLCKFLIIQLKQRECEFPIYIKINNYVVPDGMSLLIDKTDLPKKDKRRFQLKIPQENFVTFMLHNLGYIPWSLYDYHLSTNQLDFSAENWREFTSDDHFNCIKIEYTIHPYGNLFYLDYVNRPNKVLDLIQEILRTPVNIKPFKLRMKEYNVPPGMEIYEYADPKDFIIKAKDLPLFFKYNLRHFINHSKFKYTEEEIEEIEEDDDGWTTCVNKRKNKRNNARQEREIIEEEINQIVSSFT
ncbi:hypothetical protein CPAV1605_575 [seawater metagenome]|uniref:Uncharacterized protein n=1 Tax=seawater metagenome TaxID=1561972 RepID=A0A5E8CM51_9ZZZZ